MKDILLNHTVYELKMDDKVNDKIDSNRIERMQLGKFEFATMNNIFRRFIQKYFEFSTFKYFLKKHNVNLKNQVVIDAGCGSGYSSELIMKEFNSVKIIAFDIMPEQIKLAENRNIDINFYVGDVTAIEAEDRIAKAVFVFGVIHHVPEWKKAINEFSRVLTSGGVVLIEEPQYNYTWTEFENKFKEAGFKLLDRKNLFFFNYFRSYIFQKG